MVLPRLQRGIRTAAGFVSNVIGTQAAARYALPQLRPGLNQQVTSFANLCDTFDGYRFNTIFEQLGGAAFDVVTAQDIKDLKPRGIYNPVPIIIDYYAKHTLTGRMVPSPKDDTTMLEDPDAAMPDGDLWVVSTNPVLEEAIIKVWDWSNLQLTKTELATNCATYGNCLLIVNEEPPSATGPGKVFIEVAHPATLTDMDFDRAGNMTYARVETTEFERPDGSPDSFKVSYRLTRIYTPSYYEVRRNGEVTAKYPNPHGFVPVVLVKHLPVTGDVWGLNCFAHALPQIHELCLVASVLGTNIMMHNKPRWMIFGAGAPAPTEEIEAVDDMWFFPDGSKADTMIPKLGIQDTYVHIEGLLSELEDLLPELHLNKIGSGKRDVSGAGVRGLMSGLIRRGLDARERYEEGLKAALTMAIIMGQRLGGTSTNVFGQTITGDLTFEFHWPDILPMNRLERLRVAAEEKTLELQIVIQEAQIQLAQKDPSFLLTLVSAPKPGFGGNTPPPASPGGQPAQGTPAQ